MKHTFPEAVPLVGGDGGGGGNKLCFIFTTPLAKYRPVFPWDIDISGVARLLLLTPFLHCHGIYVFFLRVSFPPPFFSHLCPDLHLHQASLFLSFSFLFAHSFIFFGLLIRISFVFLRVLGLASCLFRSSILPSRFPPRWKGRQSIARIPAFCKNSTSIRRRNKLGHFSLG